MKKLKQCSICRRTKWFPVEPTNKKLSKKEKEKYTICLSCRMMMNQFKNMQKSADLHAKINVIEDSSTK